MKQRAPRSASFDVSRLYLPVLVAFCALTAWRALTANDDFWAHAAVGRWIWNHHAFPEYSLFLWSVDRFPWVAHSWLSQLFFYGLLEAGGGWTADGNRSTGSGPLVVMVFTTAIACGVWLLLWRLWKRTSRPSALVLLLFALAVWASSLRYQPRPELLTALFWTALLCALVKRGESSIEYSIQSPAVSTRAWTKTKWTKTEIALPFMFALWANFHGAVALGVVLMLLTVLCDAWQDRLNGRSRRFLLLALACALATALVPFGALRYWSNIFSATQSATFAQIVEWQPLLPLKDVLRFARGGAGPDLLFYAISEFVLAVTALLAWNANPQRRWAHAVWIVFMGVLLLRQRRHLWLFALVCVAVMAANATFFETRSLVRFVRARFGRARFGRERFGRERFSQRSSTRSVPVAENFADSDEKPLVLAWLRPLLQAIVLLFVMVSGLANASPDFWARRAISPLLPDAAAQIVELQAQTLAAKGREMRLFNDYESSSYLQWRFNRPNQNSRLHDRGAVSLFIDLLNAYPDAVARQYISMMNATPEGQRLIQQLNINCIVLDQSWRKKEPALALNKNRQWQHIYQGNDGDVWVLRAF